MSSSAVTLYIILYTVAAPSISIVALPRGEGLPVHLFSHRLLDRSRQTVSMTGTIDTLLKHMSPDDDSESFDKSKTIQNIKVVLDGLDDAPKRAYFVCDELLSFRHAGDGDKKPSQVFVTSLDTYDKNVVILYSASGSGKTVELAASSVTRGTHLAFVLSVTEDAEPGRHDQYVCSADG